jgi:hypothetical protein
MNKKNITFNMSIETAEMLKICIVLGNRPTQYLPSDY